VGTSPRRKTPSTPDTRSFSPALSSIDGSRGYAPPVPQPEVVIWSRSIRDTIPRPRKRADSKDTDSCRRMGSILQN